MQVTVIEVRQAKFGEEGLVNFIRRVLKVEFITKEFYNLPSGHFLHISQDHHSDENTDFFISLEWMPEKLVAELNLILNRVE